MSATHRWSGAGAAKVRLTRVGGSLGHRGRDGRPDAPGAGGPGEAEGPHQAPGPVAADRDPVADERPPGLADPVDPEVVGVDPGDLRGERPVRDLPGGRRPPLRGVVGRWGDLQHPADRLDPVGSLVVVDVRDHRGERRSSSAPKKTAALLRISLARRNSRLSRSNSFMRARSAVVRPVRSPSLISAWRTHSRTDSDPMPSDFATRVTAPWRSPCSVATSRTRRTARSLNSGGYRRWVGWGLLLRSAMTPSSSKEWSLHRSQDGSVH